MLACLTKGHWRLVLANERRQKIVNILEASEQNVYGYLVVMADGRATRSISVYFDTVFGGFLA
jgi:hypothetical protein